MAGSTHERDDRHAHFGETTPAGDDNKLALVESGGRVRARTRGACGRRRVWPTELIDACQSARWVVVPDASEEVWGDKSYSLHQRVYPGPHQRRGGGPSRGGACSACRVCKHSTPTFPALAAVILVYAHTVPALSVVRDSSEVAHPLLVRRRKGARHSGSHLGIPRVGGRGGSRGVVNVCVMLRRSDGHGVGLPVDCSGHHVGLRFLS